MRTNERNVLNPIVLNLKQTSMLSALKAAHAAFSNGTLRKVPRPDNVDAPTTRELRVKAA